MMDIETTKDAARSSTVRQQQRQQQSSYDNVRQSSAAGRSVVDYNGPDELRRALEICTEAVGYACAQAPPGKSDWLLPVPDPDAEQQSVQNELQRLLTLKSYLLLDTAREAVFDRLTKEACAVYNVPISLISLVDLGRQFFLSNTGLDENVREGSRTSAFCSHTILSKKDICVVPDTYKDARFRNNCLVTGGPRLRFYAGAPLISPEGYKLGTFCVEGPDPRPEGLSLAEQEKLKEFARKAMALMVERRKNVQRAYEASNLPANRHLRRHAAVTTNLGSLIYKYCRSEAITAMRLFQESVQTLMHIEGENAQQAAIIEQKICPRERQRKTSELFEMLFVADTDTLRKEIIQQVHALFPDEPVLNPQKQNSGSSIPGLFSTSSKLRSPFTQQNGQSLFFNEAFEVHMQPTDDEKDPLSKLDDRSFTIPLEQCSKATLFNMGLIHYHWGSADSAMQFFDLAASLSQQHDATNFDPVVLGCLNNMAQIHLAYGRSDDAMALLSDALTRGNAALTTIYASTPDDASVNSQDTVRSNPQSPAREGYDVRRTRRLRRKLSRTLLNIGHVHFLKCEYDNALAACNDALMLLHTNMDEVEVVAVWYNMAIVNYHKGDKVRAVKKLELFLTYAESALPQGPHVQKADAIHKKGKILFEMGNLYESMTQLNEALRMRYALSGKENNPGIAETLFLIGKILQEREEYDFALNALNSALSVQRNIQAAYARMLGEEQFVSFEVAQTLLEIGRAQHALGRREISLNVYLEVLYITRKFFGQRHPFVARIENIVGNICLECGKTSDAIQYFQEAMRIYIEKGLYVDLNIVQDPFINVQLDHHPAAQAA